MVATECRDLAKVGGLGDVIRDLSAAIHALGIPTKIIMPYYESIQCTPKYMRELSVIFNQAENAVKVFVYDLDNVEVFLLQNMDFFGGDYGEVYVDSNEYDHGPFEDDAKRFAFFSAATAELLKYLFSENRTGVLHCHDWHTGSLLVLLSYDKRYQTLKNKLHSIFTIHNLDYQGSRPFELEGQRPLLSFSSWFPKLYRELKKSNQLTRLRDPRTPELCFNPMRAGINLSRIVTTVSPTYAKEITRPDDPTTKFFGGRGLEHDLRRLMQGKRLYGILNGLDYSRHNPMDLKPPYDVQVKNWQNNRLSHKLQLLKKLPEHLFGLKAKIGHRFKNSQRVLEKLHNYHSETWLKRPLVVSVTRAVQQKISILFELTAEQQPVFQEILKRDLNLIIFGTGEMQKKLEQLNQYDNALFVCGFDPDFATQLYAGGDIFLMPSDFEPCGISQMIAMRYGCLPLVHDIGGLHDTVQDSITGFVYSGRDRKQTIQNFLHTLDRALSCFRHQPEVWQTMQVQAMRKRFDWHNSAQKYLKLYEMICK